MKRRQLGILVIAAIALVALAVFALQANLSNLTGGGSAYGLLNPQQLSAMLEKKDFAFINVHIPYEGELAQTDDFIPFNEIEANLNTFPQNKNAKIVLYCRSGHMSSLAAAELVQRGYTDVSHLEGGMVEWQKDGLPVLFEKR